MHSRCASYIAVRHSLPSYYWHKDMHSTPCAFVTVQELTGNPSVNGTLEATTRPTGGLD